MHSPTEALSDIYLAREPRLDALVASLTPHPRQSGLAALREGRLVAIDLFDLPSTYREIHPKLLRAYALESMAEMGDEKRREAPDSERRGVAEEAPGTLERFLEGLLAIAPNVEPSRGLGVELRVESLGGRAQALVWDDALVHLTAHAHELD